MAVSMQLLSAAILRLQLIALATIVSSLPTSSVASRQGGSAGLVNTGVMDYSLRIRGGGACFPCTGGAALRQSVPDPQKSTVEHEFVVFFEEQVSRISFRERARAVALAFCLSLSLSLSL